MGSCAPSRASPAINSSVRGREDGATALRALSLLGALSWARTLPGARVGGGGRGKLSGSQGGVRHAQVGPQRTYLAGSPTHLVVCCLSSQLFSGRGRDNSAVLETQCATSHLAEEAGNGRSPTAGKLQASPAPASAGESLPVDGTGNPLLSRQPSLDRLCREGSGAPGGLCTTLRRERPARRRGLRWKLQDFLSPRGVQPNPLLVAPPNLRPGAGWWLRVL